MMLEIIICSYMHDNWPFARRTVLNKTWRDREGLEGNLRAE
jgi:hypothetical protein